MKLSIITVVFNDRAGLEKTLLSVYEQRRYFPAVEYIVIDGGSADGTRELIDQYVGKIDKWVSESDSGIYDAMNKGIRMASGDALLFLNAGDYFVGDVLSGLRTVPAFLPVKYIDALGRFRDRPINNERFTISNCHQGIVFENKGVFYDSRFDIAADYKFFLDHGYTAAVERVTSSGHVFFDAVGVSATRIYRRDAQIFQIRRDRFGLVIALVYEIVPFAKRVARFVLRK